LVSLRKLIMAGSVETFASETIPSAVASSSEDSDLELRASSCADLLRLMEEDGFPEKIIYSVE
jgi:hypothetical protein